MVYIKILLLSVAYLKANSMEMDSCGARRAMSSGKFPFRLYDLEQHRWEEVSQYTTAQCERSFSLK